jgi:hypothetical protein
MAYVEVTLQIDPNDRAAAAGVYTKYKQLFLADVPGASPRNFWSETKTSRSCTDSTP